MKGYNRRQNHNSGKAQRIAERKEAKRQEREQRRKDSIEGLKAQIEWLDKHPDGICEFMGGYMPRPIVKKFLEKALTELENQ